MLRVLLPDDPDRAALLARLERRGAEVLPEVERDVRAIVEEVRKHGDAAVRAYTERFEKRTLTHLELARADWEAQAASVTPAVQASIARAAMRIAQFHAPQKAAGYTLEEGGARLELRVQPLERVGLYVPGGTAAYPSSLLMSAIPARVAGVEEIVVATPPGRDGAVPASTLAAARVAGVHRIVKAGGAQAIAALAYGTASVPRVDKIFGPGNIFVALAKQRVAGVVAIDQVAGPTETLIIADEGADPELAAADLLAQAEHDPMASALLLTTSAALAERVRCAIDEQLPRLSRREIIAASLEANGGIVVVPDLATAVELANGYAPEHLCLLVRDPWALVESVRNAGGIFLGEASAEVMGDYVAGPSHVMPTGGTARFASPLNVEEFVKVISLIGLNERGMRELGPAAATLAECEGLTAHAAAVRRRLQGG